MTTPPTAVATGRVNIAFSDDTLAASPTWTRLDSTHGLVAYYTIDRGRQYELDRTDGGRATVYFNDVNGVLDPTNSSGPYYGEIEPLRQITLGRYNPVTATWQTRFRGFIDNLSYDFDPSQKVNRLTLECVDLFEILNTVQMFPDGTFGDPGGTDGYVFFDDANVDDRINQIYTNCGIPSAFYVTFTGNVGLYEALYSPGESAMTAIQEAADAEFPGVSNVFVDRFGRICFHGRLAKFEPSTIAAGAGSAAWNWQHWKCGDMAAVIANSSTTAQLRAFGFERGLSKIINYALASPVGISDADVSGQITTDGTSVGLYGIRAWSAQNLLTREGLLDSSDPLTETKRFSSYYVDNYKDPHNRATTLTFRSIDPNHVGGTITWKLMTEADISDQIDVTIASPGGGSFTLEPFFIEGVHEENRPLNSSYDDVTISFDVSPQGLYSSNPFPTS